MSRLSWFPFYVSDWLGGTASMLPSEKGSYLSALLAQWQSGDLKAIPDDPARLVSISGGNDFTPNVRAKFQEIKIKGAPFLRNKKLADLWDTQKGKHDASSRGGKSRSNGASSTSSNEASNDPEHQASLSRVEPQILKNEEEESKSHSLPRSGSLSAHLGLQAVRSLISQYPNKVLWKEIVEVVGDNPDLAKMQLCFSEWVKRGNNKVNFAWLFEWYANGGPPSDRPRDDDAMPEWMKGAI